MYKPARISLSILVLFATTMPAALADDAALLKRIEVPDGFEVSVAASPGLVKHPLMACFDDRGRLFIAESAGMNLRPDVLEKELPNFVRMLEDTDGDGKFDKSTIFADKMTLPQGALWHDNALYVASPPNIWRLEDTDDDGVCDKRTVIVSKFGYNGNAASIHGCFLGPFGRIYWCDGRHGHEFTDDDGKVVSKGKAARIFSCKPDGSDVQVFCGGGMDNPVEIDWTEEGEMIGTVNLFYRKRGDCLVHWVRGGVYPRYDQQACIDEFPSTGEPLTEIHNFGHVAVSGMTRYRDAIFGEEYRNNIFVTQFNTHKVVRAILKPDGSTYSATEHEFLKINDDDSHPTDVLQDADGSLLVIDTGGWFRIGCPTSQIAKPNILGAIYRVRKKGAKVLDDPRGLKIDWAKGDINQLLPLLDDDRFAVRERAVTQLGAGEIKNLRSSRPASPQRPGVRLAVNMHRALARVPSGLSQLKVMPTKGNLISDFIDDVPDVLDCTMIRAIELTENVVPDGIEIAFSHHSAAVRRVAIRSVGNSKPLPYPEALEFLIDELAKPNDRHLEHSIIYALIKRDDPSSTLPFLKSEHPAIQRGALIALDQMPSGKLTREQVAPFLQSSDEELRTTALAIMQRHPDWADDVTDLLGDLLAKAELKESDRGAIAGSIIAFATNDKLQKLVGDGLASDSTSSDVKLLLLEALGQADVKPLPASWSSAMKDLSLKDDSVLLNQLVGTINQIGPTDFTTELNRVAVTASYPSDVRTAAYYGLSQSDERLNKKSLQYLVSTVKSAEEAMTRLAAAQALGAGKIADDDLSLAMLAIADAGPLELPPLLGMLEGQTDEKIGRSFVTALEKSPGSGNLSREQLTKLLEPFPTDVKDAAKPLLAKLSAGSDPKALQKMYDSLTDGDIERGRAVFAHKKTNCTACHRIGNKGGRIGPDLSTIGQRRTKRDLLEAIVYPSASFARGFESFGIVTDDGKVVNGMITRESAKHLHVRTPEQRDIKVARDDIEVMKPSRVSIMPQGIDKTMTPEQLSDLLAYLSSLKQ